MMNNPGNEQTMWTGSRRLTSFMNTIQESRAQESHMNPNKAGSCCHGTYGLGWVSKEFGFGGRNQVVLSNVWKESGFGHKDRLYGVMWLLL